MRRTGQNVRFEVRKACEQERWRLKVLYEQPDPDSGELRTVQLGLVWAEDRSEVTSLRDRLARGEPGRASQQPVASASNPPEEPPSG